MFHAYVKLFARHVSWLEKRFPTYMYAKRYEQPFKYLVSQLLIAPSVIGLVILPLSLLVLLVLSIPVNGNIHVLLILGTFLLFFFFIIRELVRELKGR